MTETLPLAARVLVAMPGMDDHRFVKSVIYICAHSDEGAMGLILNRPLPDLPLSKLLSHMDIAVTPDTPAVPVHFGGPVERGRGFVLHDQSYRSDTGTMQITDDIALSATMEIIERIAAGTGPARLIFGLGYAGWGPHQLEAEISRNFWMITDADADFLFSGDPDTLWRRAMERAGIDPRILSSSHGHA